MRDLTKDAVAVHMLVMSAPVAMTLITHILYQLVSLYFLLELGPASAAGAGAIASAVLLITALGQIIDSGTVSLISRAVGRKDQHDANLIFNQSLSLAASLSLLTTIVFVALGPTYMQAITADPATIDAGTTFLFWALPGYVAVLPVSSLAGALRGMGVVRPTMLIYIVSILINMLLAPILITGWATGMALGVMGAGIATSISGLLSLTLLATYARRSQKYLRVAPVQLPRFSEWRRIIRIGLPNGSEFAFTFASAAVTLHTISIFGASAQAGFSIGQRILQAILVPGISIAYAAGPIAGQSLGARKCERVREAFRHAVVMGTGIMVLATIFLQQQVQVLLDVFGVDAATVAVARSFLLLMSWTLVAQVLVYSCKIMFTGLGNTLPTLLSSALQFVVFAVPVLWASNQSHFRIEHIWYLSISSMTLQALVSLLLLRREFRRTLVSGFR